MCTCIYWPGPACGNNAAVKLAVGRVATAAHCVIACSHIRVIIVPNFVAVQFLQVVVRSSRVVNSRCLIVSLGIVMLVVVISAIAVAISLPLTLSSKYDTITECLSIF